MPKFRYWYLDDKEDPEFDSTIEAFDAGEAAEMAVQEMINDGEPPSKNKIELVVRLIDPPGDAEMFEVFVDWSPECTAYNRGILPSKP